MRVQNIFVCCPVLCALYLFLTKILNQKTFKFKKLNVEEMFSSPTPPSFHDVILSINELHLLDPKRKVYDKFKPNEPRTPKRTYSRSQDRCRVGGLYATISFFHLKIH